MSELIEVPRWFDNIHKEVVDIIKKEFSYSSEPEDTANELLIKAISNHGHGTFWTDDLIREILFPSVTLLNMIQHKEEEKIEYVTHNKINLIKAIVNGYGVKEDKYLVMSRNDYESTGWSIGETTLIYSGNISKVRHLYYEDDNQLERYKDFDSSLLSLDLVFGKYKQELIEQIQETEPNLFMNEEKPQKLFNAYRVIIPINI